jgi:hypothetical protein
MRIEKISENAHDLSEVHDQLKDVLKNLNSNNIGKAKYGIVELIKEVERLRPHLKYKNLPVRGRI